MLDTCIEVVKIANQRYTEFDPVTSICYIFWYIYSQSAIADQSYNLIIK